MPSSERAPWIKAACFCLGFLAAAGLTMAYGSTPRLLDIGDFPVVANKNIMVQNACWVAGADAYFTGGHVAASIDAMPVSLLNYVLRHEGHSPDSFTMVNAGALRGFGMGQTLSQLEILLKSNSDKNILYFNAPGGFVVYSAELLPETLCTLERVGREYPGAAQLAGEIAEPLRAKVIELGMSPRCPAVKPTWKTLLRDRGAQVISLLWGRFLAEKTAPSAGDVRTLLERHARQYASPELTTVSLNPPMPPERYFTHAEDEAFYLKWLQLFATLAAQRQSRFLMVIPPQAQVSPDRMRDQFQPLFVEKVKEALKGFPNAHVFDLSARTEGFTPSDLTFFGAESVMYRPGDTFFVTGKLRQARMLAEAFARAGVVSLKTQPRPTGDTLGVAFPSVPAIPWSQNDAGQYQPSVYMEGTPRFTRGTP